MPLLHFQQPNQRAERLVSQINSRLFHRIIKRTMLTLRPGSGELVAQGINGKHYAGEILSSNQCKSVQAFAGLLKLLDVLARHARQGNQQRIFFQ